MKGILDFIKRAIVFLTAPWRWLVKLATNKNFILIFPLVVFLIACLAMKSVLFGLCTLIWLIPIVKGVDENAS